MADDPFIRDFDPTVGVAEPLRPDLRRIVAPNASAMTFRGTNTYVLGATDMAIIDPGPDNEAHLQAILASVGPAQKISHIIVTHSHVDHSPLAARLSGITGAPVLAYGDSFSGRSEQMTRLAAQGGLGGGEGVDTSFSPDIHLQDGQIVKGAGWSLQAIYTPGHFSNHLCFAWREAKAVFSGDHVMSWATTMVSPPDGDLSAFMRSLDKMAARRQDKRYYPGHGAPLDAPHDVVAYLIGHRNQRTRQILQELRNDSRTPIELAGIIYTDIPAALIPAAARNVFAHLIDLTTKNIVFCDGNISPHARFRCV